MKYANITAEELEVLNISYNKEHYMFDQQHQRNNTVLFCGLESEKGCATDLSQIADVTLHRISQQRSDREGKENRERLFYHGKTC